jgi:ketosteroid isomerase-like protein
MWEERRDLVSRAIALGAARRWEELFALVDPEIEWRDQMHAPDVPETIHGVGQLRGLIAYWDAVYEGLTSEVVEFIDADPWVICRTRWHATGKGSGVEVDVHSVDAYEVLDGRVTRTYGGYADLASAERAIAQAGARG